MASHPRDLARAPSVDPALWLLLPGGDGSAVALYGGCLGGLFGVVFLRYALVG